MTQRLHERPQMRSSIRSLLAGIALAAILLLGWMNYTRALALRSSESRLSNLIQIQEAVLLLDDPDCHHALLQPMGQAERQQLLEPYRYDGRFYVRLAALDASENKK